MYTDIEKQLNKITDNLKTSLIDLKAIDEEGNAADMEKFNSLLDEKIAQCEAVLATTEQDGVTKDLYGANIAHARIEWLKNIKKYRTLNPTTKWHEEDIGEKKARSEKTKKISIFNSGICKLFSMFQSKTRNINSNENNR